MSEILHAKDRPMRSSMAQPFAEDQAPFSMVISFIVVQTDLAGNNIVLLILCSTLRKIVPALVC